MVTLGIRLRKPLVEIVVATPALAALIITEEEWLYLGEIHEVLEPFWDKTNWVSQKAPTITQSVGVYWDLDDILHDVVTKSGVYSQVNEKIRLAVKQGLVVLEEYTAKMDDNIIYYVASVLDPRVKTEWLKAHLKDGANSVIQDIRDYLHAEYPQEPTLPTPMATSISRGMKLPSTQRRMHERIQRAHYGESALLDEIDSYLDSKPIQTPAIDDISAQEDLQWVLKWWKANRFTYPRMARIARDFIGIAAAEVGLVALLLLLRRSALFLVVPALVVLLHGRCGCVSLRRSLGIAFGELGG
jgi:hypothetical protein